MLVFPRSPELGELSRVKKWFPDRNFQELISAAVLQIICLDAQRESIDEGAVPLVCNSFILSHFAGFPSSPQLGEPSRAKKLFPDRNFQELISAAVLQILCLDVQREGIDEGAVPLVCNSFILSHFAGFPRSPDSLESSDRESKNGSRIAISRSC